MKTIIFLIVFVVCTWVFGFAAFTLSVLTITPRNPEQTTDAIVVLTGGSNRIETGMNLFAEGKAPNLFITGVHENVSKEEILARHLGPKLPECCVTIGHKATTTKENASETKDWLKENKNIHSVRLVTSNYHIPRALLEFRNAVPDIELYAQPVMQPDITPHDRYFWIVTFEEYHKTLFRFFDIMREDLR